MCASELAERAFAVLHVNPSMSQDRTKDRTTGEGEVTDLQIAAVASLLVPPTVPPPGRLSHDSRVRVTASGRMRFSCFLLSMTDNTVRSC